MYIICYVDFETKRQVWESVGGEDAMHMRVDEIFRNGIPISEIFVFDESCHIDNALSSDENSVVDIGISKILETFENSAALAGYKIMDGHSDSLIIRDVQKDKDYEITVTECL